MRSTLTTLLLLLAPLGGTLEGQTAANVLLVINNESGVSRRIGEYYASRRELPGANICRISAVEREEITRPVYAQEIEAPIADCLGSRELQDQILYIVTTKGVPLKIAGAGGLRASAAAVDSELTLLYQRLQGKRLPVDGPLPNPFFGKLNRPFEHDAFPIYLVTRLTGYDFEDVRAMIDRSTRARNRGWFVLDAGTGKEQGDNWLRAAAAALPSQRVLLDSTRNVLYDVEDVIGYASWGSNDVQRGSDRRRRLGFRWLPGAIATEYVSTNARTFAKPPDDWTFTGWGDKGSFWRGSPQGLTADSIHEGATGASGHVYEPYLPYTPRPQFLLPAYYSGRNLAESYYLAIPGLSWMNVVVGDPLCRLGPPGPQ